MLSLTGRKGTAGGCGGRDRKELVLSRVRAPVRPGNRTELKAQSSARLPHTSPARLGFAAQSVTLML